MKKSELQSIYNEVKRQKSKKTTKGSLFESTKPKKTGCRTCGKVTWKPY